MPLEIESGESAGARSGIKGCILGPSGIGKTSQLLTLPPATTLLLDAEAGHLSVRDWLKAGGNRIDMFKTAQTMGAPAWEIMRGLACWLGGPSPLAAPGKPYSREDYAAMCEAFGDPARMDRYDTVFIDSITVASRACFAWCQTQPEAFSEKTGKPDIRGAYGLLGREMVGWLTQLQHVAGKNVWMVGILDKETDEFNRSSWQPQIMGSGTKQAMPGIFDQVVSMVEMATETGEKYRAFVCQTLNPGGYPAKDRSGALDVIEPPDLGALMAKINSAPPRPSLVTAMPAATVKVPT
jgi:hypothetical protein